MDKLNIIGAGLAGSEAAWQAAEKGIKVNIFEMRGDNKLTAAHKTSLSAELVCSNSFRNDDINSAIGLLHAELRRLDSLIMQSADLNKLPAGSALAVDREQFSEYIHHKIINHPNINYIPKEITEITPNEKWIIATGPLTSDKLAAKIIKLTNDEQPLAFFDAISPIVYKDSIDFGICWFQSRYDKTGPGGGAKDYINCPLNKEQYYNFVSELIKGEKTEFKEWEKNTPYFNGCLPIEVMAERGVETLRFGPMKPVGLNNIYSDQKPYAVVQLRQDNKLGNLYNIVGFQTKLKYKDQERIFHTIPGLENALFARFGGIHRNSFINSPRLLNTNLELKFNNNIKFAGQITGVEGYIESAAIGLIAGHNSALELLGYPYTNPPIETAIGSLIHHITCGAEESTFQPMNINFGLMPALDNLKINKKEKYQRYSERALKYLGEWSANNFKHSIIA